MDTDRITFGTIFGGNLEVLRVLGRPLAEKLEAALPPDGIELHTDELPGPLQWHPNPQMGVDAIAATIGVLAFLSSWAAKKVLDEIYVTKIRPKIEEVFNSTSARSLPNKPGKKWLFQLGVWYEEERVLILLTLVGDNLKQVLAQEYLLPSLHSQAVNWLIQNGTDSPIHLYLAEDGKANLAPLKFTHISEAQLYIEALWPVIIPTDGNESRMGSMS
jgi:hypothetical protein